MSWDIVKTCTVPLTNPDGKICGTGFFISQEGYLLTCAHVVEEAGGWQQLRVRGQTVSLVYLGKPTSDNFAVLQLSGYQGQTVPLSVSCQLMERFLSIGYGHSDFPQGASIDGMITDINPQANFGNLPMLRLRVIADPLRVQGSYMGSPVFDAANQCIVGLIATHDHTEGALAIPLTTVREKWSTLERLLQKQPIDLPAKPAEVGAKVFISYHSQDPDLSLAQQFYEALKSAGHQPFMAGTSIALEEVWPKRLMQELEQCDYFLLLLSAQEAFSELIIEVVRRVKQLRDSRPEPKPVILPIRVNAPDSLPLNFNLRSYLHQIQLPEWQSPADTPTILPEVLKLIAQSDKDIQLYTPEEESPAVDSLDHPPLPVAEPQLPEGEVELASAFYMERVPEESECYEAILQPNALIRIKAPRQMGKTSLMARILHQAGQHGCRTVSLSFQLADAKVFTDLNQFLRWFCASISWELGLPPNRLNDYWNDFIGSKLSCSAYFERYLLPEIGSPLALGLDDVDCIFKYQEIAIDFFRLLRVWHEKGKNNPTWKKLRLVMVHSTEMYIPMNVNESPFNVGLSIELPEFTPQQVQDLARRHGLNWKLASVEQLMTVIGGHPFLVRLALYHIARQEMTLDELLKTAPTEAGPFGDHLRRHWWNLEQHPELFAAITQVVSANNPVRVEPEQAFRLRSMGLVDLQGNEVTIRFDLYRQYFRDRLRIS